MGGEVGNIVFIVWRESVEALLVIGILNAWLSRQTDKADAVRGRRFLWSGVAAGLLIAVGLAATLAVFGHLLSGDAQQLFQTTLELIAAALIVQMVFWMRRRGRTLKRDIEANLTQAASHADWWTVFLLALVAVAREGNETVVFLYGTLSALPHGSVATRVGAVALGIAAALATYLALQLGSRVLSWRGFFRATEIMLLCLAGSLLVSAADNLMALDIIPALSGRLWDSSTLLPDTGRAGGLLVALTGYRARPDLTEVLVLACYWTMMAWLLLRSSPIRTRPA
jgi:high-affinity iron transporter